MNPIKGSDINQNETILVKKAEYKEEGPWPQQGNIGVLLGQTGFKSDKYTKMDTCGSNCVLKAPESYGNKNLNTFIIKDCGNN